MSFDINEEKEKKELTAEFLLESEAHINGLNRNLLCLEELIKENKEVSYEIINEMFKAVHSIKGVSGFFGFDKIKNLTEEIEFLIDKVKNKNIILSNNIMNIFFEAFKDLNKIFSKLKKQDEKNCDYDVEPIINKLKKTWENYNSQEKYVIKYDIDTNLH